MSDPFRESDFPSELGLAPEPAASFNVSSDPIHDKYRRFIPVAFAFAEMSKTTRTRVGAVILGPGFEVRSSGWNGAPRGCQADVDERSITRSSRLRWAVHAEANAIANAARSGTPLQDCAIVVTRAPCMDCAKLIVQAGITQVFCPPPNGNFAAQWEEDIRLAKQLFQECNIHLNYV